MSLKKILEIKLAQSMIEYLCVTMVITGALLSLNLLLFNKNNPIFKAFNDTVNSVISNDFGAK